MTALHRSICVHGQRTCGKPARPQLLLLRLKTQHSCVSPQLNQTVRRLRADCRSLLRYAQQQHAAKGLQPSPVHTYVWNNPGAHGQHWVVMFS